MIRLIVLDPAHFHAGLLQKKMYPEISPEVHIYAEKEHNLREYLRQIEQYNSRLHNPTRWKNIIYTGADFLDKMRNEKAGNLVILAGNNKKRISYLQESINAGFNILADKPLCIEKSDYFTLIELFDAARNKNLLLQDIMTERFAITHIIQKELIKDRALFGDPVKGTADDPAIIMRGTHHFFKQIGGKNIIRPAWYFDISQTGEGITDVATHLIDHAHWAAFHEKTIDISAIILIGASHYPTAISPEEFTEVTQLHKYPDYLQPYVKDNILYVNANGTIDYTLNGYHIRIEIKWNYKAAHGKEDRHFSKIKGTAANIIIRQNERDNQPDVYIEAAEERASERLYKSLRRSVGRLRNLYPALDIEKAGNSWRIKIPDQYRIGHETRFGKVVETYLGHLKHGKLPAWETPNMIAKYFITTRALETARSQDAAQ